MPAPAECDIGVVILWACLGTLLDARTFRKPDGSPYSSGTEWEYENALSARPLPDILVYRRMDQPQIDLYSPTRARDLEQFDNVAKFIERLSAPAASIFFHLCGIMHGGRIRRWRRMQLGFSTILRW